MSYIKNIREFFRRFEKTGLPAPKPNGLVDNYNTTKPSDMKYNLKNKDPWCAAFASLMISVCDCTHAAKIFECSCGRMIERAKKAGLWIEDDNYMPVTGDLIMYDWNDSGKGDNTGWPDHVGVVVDVSHYAFIVLEGNVKNKIAQRRVLINDKYIRGFISLTENTYEEKLDPDDVLQKAKETVLGKYGNGRERRVRLGLWYTSVQARVNQYYKNGMVW